MNQGYDRSSGAAGGLRFISVGESSAEVRMNFIRKTYVLFMAGILMAIVAGTLCLNNEGLLSIAISILRMPILAFALIIGGSIGAQAVSRTEGLNYVALFAFTALIGFIFAPIIAMYEMSQPGIVVQAAALTTLLFGSLTAYAFVSRKDFNFMGGMLFVGMIGLIGAGLLNMLLFKSAGFSYWISWGVLFMSSGFVLYRTSRMIHIHAANEYCSAALDLFVSFFNIFMSILRILGGSRN